MRRPVCSDGLDISFVQSQYGGTGGEGIIVWLRNASAGNANAAGASGSLYFGPSPASQLSAASSGMAGGIVGLAMAKVGELRLCRCKH